MVAGYAFGMFVVLVSILGFIRYAHVSPGVQSLSYFWGLANGWFLKAIVEGQPAPNVQVEGTMPYIGQMARNITWQVITLGGAQGPDWFTPDFVQKFWLGLSLFVVYLYLVAIWGIPLPGHAWIMDMATHAKARRHPQPARANATAATREPAAATRSTATRRPVRRRGTEEAA
jgi:hypothetical protein